VGQTPTMPDEPTDPTPDAATSSSGRSVSLHTVVVVALVLGLLATVGVTWAQVGRAQDAEDDLAARDEVAAAASVFGEVYLSYDFDDPDRSGDRVLELVSPAFAEDFERTRAPGIEELFSNLGTTTSASTTQVFVGDVGDDAATALVVVDVVARSEASGTQELTDLTFVLELVRDGDRWLVDDVVPAPQPDLAGDGVEDPPASSTTTTTAPVP
jgi:Mce-associated membrane protein